MLSRFVYVVAWSFVKFIPKHFIIYDTSITGIVLLILFSGCLSLINRNRIDFCTVTFLCPITLQNPFVSSHTFGVDSSEFSL